MEVLKGKCFKFSSRAFVDSPLSKSDIGVVSPRMFFDHDPEKTFNDGGYFESSVFNSFPDIELRIKFLHCFYQCFLFGQLIHKVPKLIVVGKSDSGKSSWARMFFGMLHQSKIVSISKEKTFGLSMIKDDSELVLIDELCNDTMDANTAKSVLQGGRNTVSVKQKTPEVRIFKGGFFLNCNEMPDWGDEQENVEKRLAIFKTTKLPKLNMNAPQWIEDNALQCFIWMVNQINRNIALIPVEDRFYEKPLDVEQEMVQNSQNDFPEQELQKLLKINIAELQCKEIEPEDVVYPLQEESDASSYLSTDEG